MAHVWLQKLQRGPTVTAIISFLKVHGTENSVPTTTIDVNGLVDLNFIIKCKSVSNNSINLFVRMKKKTNSQDSTVQIQINQQQFFCSEQWVETEMQSVPFQSCSDSVINNMKIRLYSYFIKVDITVREITPVPSYPVCLHEDTEYTDFQLQATDGNVAVHRMFLMAHSDVFKAMMRGEWKEKAVSEISIDGVTIETLKHLKDYIYLGVLPDDGLESLLIFAARYLMGKLKMDCVTKLAHSITLEKISDLVKLACQHNIPELVEALLYQMPDKIINDFYQLKNKGQELNVKEEE